jgi:hypothetical protein
VSVLDPRHFIDPSPTIDAIATTKPFDVGLFTSTPVFGTFGMWWCYLQLNAGSTLFPPPWVVWSADLRADLEVLEIVTAMDWAEFVAQSPIVSAGIAYPNWKYASQRWDGIHITVRAIVALQGIRLSHKDLVIAPAFWDVESTLWLRWAFARVKRVSTVHA